MKAVIVGFVGGGSQVGAIVQAYDNSGTSLGLYQENFTMAYADALPSDFISDILPQVATGLTADTLQTFTAANITVLSQLLSPIPATAMLYQTIVSQTGTAAPAVSGGFTPMSTYTAGTTFTWARTGAGVYTLTASTAVFNTSGKTGVFVAPLQNLNASVRAVVTSTTVITVTTAVQSVAVLGLLGLTTTATDALLSGTMIYVQTYA